MNLRKAAITAVCVMLVGAVGWATTLTFPYTFSPGTTIFSAQVNANNTAVATVINGGLDHNNLSPTAGILLSQLGLNPGGTAFNKGTTGAQTWASGLTTDSVPRLTDTTDKGIQFGPGASGALDTAIQRTGVSTLQLNNAASGAATLDMNSGTISNASTISGITSLAGTNVSLTSGALVLGSSTPTAGSIKLFGGTSGSCTIGVIGVAGTTTFNLPVGNGSNGQALETDGSGNTSWQTPAPQLLLSNTVNFTGANLISMFATPIQLVPTPSAGVTAVPVAILFNFTAGGTPMTLGGNLYAQYGTTGSGGGTIATTIQSSVPTRSGNVVSVLLPQNNSTPTAAVPATAATGIYLTNSAAYSGGNGTAVVTTWYTLK